MTLTDAIDAIANVLRAALPDVPTISADPPAQTQRAVRVPAVYIEMTELDPLGNLGDGRVSADARFEAYCLVDPNAARAELACRELAARVIVALQSATRPLPGHGHLRLVRAGDASLRAGLTNRGDLDSYTLWMVEFGVELQLGDLEPAGITPSEICIGVAPLIGPPHVDDYEQIA